MRWEEISEHLALHGAGEPREQIGKDEYISFWMGKTKNHLRADGAYKDGYTEYLRNLMSRAFTSLMPEAVWRKFFALAADESQHLHKEGSVLLCEAFGMSRAEAEKTWEQMCPGGSAAAASATVDFQRYAAYWTNDAKLKGNVEPWVAAFSGAAAGASITTHAFTPGYLAHLRGVYREFRAKMSGVPGKVVRRLSLHV